MSKNLIKKVKKFWKIQKSQFFLEDNHNIKISKILLANQN